MASPKLLRGGARGWVFRPLPFTCRRAGCFQLRPPLTRPQMWVRITKDKKQIRTLFVLLDQRSGWRNGSSAHTCKTRMKPGLEAETLGCLTARAVAHPFWGVGEWTPATSPLPLTFTTSPLSLGLKTQKMGKTEADKIIFFTAGIQEPRNAVNESTPGERTQPRERAVP